MSQASPKKIKLGICMAGAVSAGAYTAGVIDYLLETLERWQREKDQIRNKLSNNKLLNEFEKAVPLHDVEIEVLSGASAGGMTAAVMNYAFIDGEYTNKQQDGSLIEQSYGLPFSHELKSKLYKCWVEMADKGGKTTLERMLETNDVKDITEMESLLNCEAIVEIAEKACPKSFPEELHLPPFVSKNLSTYLTITNIDGLPIDIKFSNTNESKNQYKMHNMLLGFTFVNGVELAHPCRVLSKANYKKMTDAAIATGAFPFGLKPQKITISNEEMQVYSDFLKLESGISVDKSVFEGTDYSFSAVDGGLINNEPYGINAKQLNKTNPISSGEVNTNFMFYVDPFPSVTNAMNNEENKSSKQDLNLMNMAMQLFSAVRNQSMLKQDDLFQAIDMNENKFLIYPRKNRLYFLACGLLGGFSGFLKNSFRKHDYHLGRKNCQAFLRFYFGRDESFFRSIGVESAPETVSRISYYPNFDQSLPKNIPLIPDMIFLKNPKATEIDNPVFESLSKDEFDQILNKISLRIDKIVDKSYYSLLDMFLLKNKCIKMLSCVFKRFAKNKISKFLTKSVSSNLSNLIRPQTIGHLDLLQNLSALIEEKGAKYYKFKEVHIRPAIPNELVISITSAGIETQKNAGTHDYVVTNSTRAREQYIINRRAFEKYSCLNDIDGIYVMKREYTVKALAFTKANFPDLFKNTFRNELKKEYIYIEASWGESQILIEGDFLVLNDRDIYRIGQSEFRQTYERVGGGLS